MTGAPAPVSSERGPLAAGSGVAPEESAAASPEPGAAPSPSGVSITVCPDGPLLVRGPAALLSADGEAVDHDRRVIALCRCGRSRLKPLCDGSHRLNRFRDAATADQLDQALNHARPLPSAPTGA